MIKRNGKVILAALIGAAIGAAGAAGIRAAETKTPAGYMIAEENVTDPATFQKYAAQVPATLAPFGGHYVVRGGKTIALEGEAPQRVVVVAFESVEKAKAWYDSPAYSAIRPIREGASKGRLFIAEGVAP
jgi:uncharacterized protein (DUF1330 family)